MFRKLGVVAGLFVLGSLNVAHSSNCFPPEVGPGSILEGRQFTLLVREVSNCWVKGLLCTRPDKCREDPYWVHVSTIEAFKADPTFLGKDKT